MDWYIVGSVAAIVVAVAALGVSFWICADLRDVRDIIRDVRKG